VDSFIVVETTEFFLHYLRTYTYDIIQVVGIKPTRDYPPSPKISDRAPRFCADLVRLTVSAVLTRYGYGKEQWFLLVPKLLKH